MKRVAFVGLSGPVFYDYKNPLREDIPNPVLESPVGLSVLFDEIVFFDERVCPKSMVDLDFVSFLSERQDFEDYAEHIELHKHGMFDVVWKTPEDLMATTKNIHSIIAPFAHWDNHSRKMDSPYTPSSFNPVNAFIDNEIANREAIDPITNSALDKIYRNSINKIHGSVISETLLAKRIPNLLKKDGPDIDFINSMRDKPNLKEFRTKIDELMLNHNDKSFEDLFQGLDEELELAKLELLDKRIFKGRVYQTKLSLPKAGVEFLNVLQNFAATPFQWASELLKGHTDKKDFGWVSFMTQLELEETRKKKKTDSS